MADALKTFFNGPLLRSLADDLQRVAPSFPAEAFVTDALDGLEPLALMARAHHIAAALRRHLPADIEDALALLVASLGPPLPPPDDTTDGTPEAVFASSMAPFRYLPHTLFTARYGLDHFEASMAAQHALTQRFSAEFSVRAFLLRHPDATYERLFAWTSDPSPHVRRLCSEGCRPRLPWASRLPAFQRDPTRVLALLERLKDDPARYVQRSVANNLNDIAKDHPATVTALCAQWAVEAPPGRAYIVRHALRSLVKQGDASALAVVGAGDTPAVRVSASPPATARIGESARVPFTLTSTRDAPQDLLIDCVVWYTKARGPARPKVFKLARLALAPGASVALTARVPLAQRTTRVVYPGAHRVGLRINGCDLPLCTIDVSP